MRRRIRLTTTDVTNTPATRVRALGGEAALAWPLFRTLTVRALRQRYKGSVLGVLWTLVTPLVMVGAYWVVFKFLFGSPIPNYALFMFVGMIGWGVFFTGIQMASGSITGNAALITKVNFPREIVPLAAITANGITTAVMLVIAVPLCLNCLCRCAADWFLAKDCFASGCCGADHRHVQHVWCRDPNCVNIFCCNGFFKT